MQHVLIPASAKRKGSTYVVAGLATYVSSRQERQLPQCQPSDLCEADGPSQQFTDIDAGANIGVGQTRMMGQKELFVESRFHQPIWRQHRAGPYSSYQLFPLTLGLRF